MGYDVNKVILRGRVGQLPETKITERYTRANFTLATTARDGQGEERTEWHRVIAWGEQASTAARLAVGQAVLVEGELRHRSWETPEGEKRYATEVVALSVTPLSVAKARKPSDTSDPTHEEGDSHG
jgi:single-strand DNA-binding protein